MNGKYPLISIIIPVYNVEPYLRRCLDSVINQTYKNLEIILIDDGSTDKSGEICEEYKKKDKRIIVIHQKNQGVSVARNTGLDIFKGEYVSFIDSDDYVDFKYIEELYYSLFLNKSDVSVCSMIEIIGTKQSKNLIFKTMTITARAFLKMTHLAYFPGKLFKRKLFKKHRFPIKAVFEDEYIYFDLIYSAQFVSLISNFLYYYARHQNSLSATNIYNKEYINDFFSTRIHTLDFIKSKQIGNKILNLEFCDTYNYYIKCSLFFRRKKIFRLEKMLCDKWFRSIVDYLYFDLNFINRMRTKFPIFLHFSRKLIISILHPRLLVKKYYE